MKDMTQDKKMVKSAIGKHEKNMHPGKTNEMMMQYGRGMAKVKNQGK